MPVWLEKIKTLIKPPLSPKEDGNFYNVLSNAEKSPPEVDSLFKNHDPSIKEEGEFLLAQSAFPVINKENLTREPEDITSESRAPL